MGITANIRLKLRTKISGLVNNYTELLNQELIFGGTEKNLFIRDSTGNGVYTFLHNDDIIIDSLNTWSSQQISNYLEDNYSPIEHTHNYYTDITNKPNKNLFLPASGITPHPNNSIACDTPIVNTNQNIPRWETRFSVGQYGFYNILIPSDYTSNSINKISICYSTDVTGITEWSFSSSPLSEGDDLTGELFPTTVNIAKDSTNINQIIYSDFTGNFSLFGSDSQNKLAPILLHLNNGDVSGNYIFYGAKIEYL